MGGSTSLGGTGKRAWERVVTSTTDKESIEVFVESEGQQAEGAPLLLGNLTENHYLSLEPIENIFKGICPFTF